MADLIDRLAGIDPDRPKIPVHQFAARLKLYAAGTITAAEAIQDWDLQGSELTQAQTLRSALDAQTGGLNKLIYCTKVESIFELTEIAEDRVYHNADGTIKKALIATHLGI